MPQRAGVLLAFFPSLSSAPQVQASVCNWLHAGLPQSQSFAAVERKPAAILASFHKTVSQWQLGSCLINNFPGNKRQCFVFGLCNEFIISLGMMCRQTRRSSRCPRLCVHVGVWLRSFILGREAAEISGFTMGPFLSQGRQETHHSSETSQKLLTVKTWSNLRFPECLPCPFLLQLFPKWLT